VRPERDIFHEIQEACLSCTKLARKQDKFVFICSNNSVTQIPLLKYAHK